MNSRSLSLLAAMVLISAPLAVSAAAPVAQIIGQWGGSCERIAVRDGIACVSQVPKNFLTLDVSDPEKVKELGKTALPDAATCIRFHDRYAYVALGKSGIAIVDVHKPESPTIVSQIDTPGEAVQIALCGHYLYVADSEGGLQIIKVASGLQPKALGKVPLSLEGRVLGVDVSANIACVSTEAGFVVLDVSNPAHPAQRSALEAAPLGLVAISGDRAYVAYECAVASYDISDPANPAQGENCVLQQGSQMLSVHDIAASGDWVFAATYDRFRPIGSGYDGLAFFDFSNPSAPRHVYTLRTPAKGVAIDSGLVYGASDAGAVITDPSAFQLFGIEAMGGLLTTRPSSLVAQGHFAYITTVPRAPTHDPGTLQIIDVTDPTQLTVVGQAPIGSEALDIAVSEGVACVTTWHSLLVFDVSKPDAPSLCKEISCERGSVAMWEHYACVTSQGKLSIFDVSDPKQATMVGQFSTKYQLWMVVAYDGYAYVQDDYGQVLMIDIHNPAHPVQIARVAYGRFRNIVVNNNVMFATMLSPSYSQTSPQLVTVDISDPLRHPIPVNLGQDNPAIVGLASYGQYVAVLCMNNTVCILDAGLGGDNPARWYQSTIHQLPFPAGYPYTKPMAMSAAGIFVGSPGFVTSKMPIGEFLHANPLQVARISNIDTKLVAGEIPLGGLLKQVAASSGRAYAIGHGERNLISLDVSNPTLPRLLDTSPTGCPVNGLASWQGYGYVLRPRGGWDIYGTPDGENLEKLGTIKSATTPEIAFSGNFAFTTDSTSFVQVVNVASPAAAQTLAKIDLGSRVVRLASGGRYVYAYLENGMIDVVDAANGAIPAKISEVAATIPVTQMYAQGQYLYARGASALRVFDVSNPSSPALLSTLDSQLSFWQFGVAGRYAYFAAGSSVNIMDVLNPASPEMVQTIGNLSRPGAIPTLARSGAQSISTSGENALVAGALGVLVIGPTPAPTPKRNTQLK